MSGFDESHTVYLTDLFAGLGHELDAYLVLAFQQLGGNGVGLVLEL